MCCLPLCFNKCTSPELGAVLDSILTQIQVFRTVHVYLHRWFCICHVLAICMCYWFACNFAMKVASSYSKRVQFLCKISWCCDSLFYKSSCLCNMLVSWMYYVFTRTVFWEALWSITTDYIWQQYGISCPVSSKLLLEIHCILIWQSCTNLETLQIKSQTLLLLPNACEVFCPTFSLC